MGDVMKTASQNLHSVRPNNVQTLCRVDSKQDMATDDQEPPPAWTRSMQQQISKLEHAVSDIKLDILEMKRMAKFLKLLERQSQGHWTLAPEGTVQHFSTDAWKLLNPGDHVVVMIGGWRRGYAHHGIVISPYGPGQDPQVAHFVSPTGDMLMRDARLQIGSHTEFIGARATFGIVPSANSEAEKYERQRSVDLAKWMVESPEFARKKYNLIAWNCECFAWVCKTGDINAHSHQVERVLKAISNDLRKGERSILLRTGAVDSSSCIVA
eukprot:gene8699-biopygen15604